MNFEQALKIMYDGGSVESLVSNTVYNFKKLDDSYRLCAEGAPVEFTYLTKEEIQGEFREIHIIDTQEELDSLSEEDKDKLMDETFKAIQNKRKFDKEFRKSEEVETVN